MAKSKYDEVVKPHLKEIEKMIEAGAKKVDIYKSLGIGKTVFYESLKEKNELSELFKKVKSKEIKKNANEVISKMPSKQFFVDRMMELIKKDNVTINDVIKVYKVFYPEEDWYRLNEEAKTQIERDRLDKGLDENDVNITINGSIGYGN